MVGIFYGEKVTGRRKCPTSFFCISMRLFMVCIYGIFTVFVKFCKIVTLLINLKYMNEIEHIDAGEQGTRPNMSKISKLLNDLGIPTIADHCTYVIWPEKENLDKFLSYWWAKWYSPLQPYITTLYPAVHTALKHDYKKCMIGASYSFNPESIINRLFNLGQSDINHGWVLQHIAYNVPAGLDFNQLKSSFESSNASPISPIFTYKNQDGSLSQAFISGKGKITSFIELIQRKTGTLFVPEQIDNLYKWLTEIQLPQNEKQQKLT